MFWGYVSHRGKCGTMCATGGTRRVIFPVCEVLLKAYKRHNSTSEVSEFTKEFIRERVQQIRDIDIDGNAFGKYEILSEIILPKSEEAIITQKEEIALEHLSEEIARLIAGQLNTCFDWCHIHHPDTDMFDTISEISNDLHCYCWNLPINSSYGLHYSKESDILWDIYEMFRYQHYLNLGDKEKVNMKHTVMADKPLHTTEESLIQIRTIE